MRALRFIWPLLALAPVGCAQGVYEMTVTESRTINVQPDQIVFGFSVDTPASFDLDGVLALLADVGVTVADLTGVSGPETTQVGKSSLQQLIWSFSLSASIAKVKDTLASLTALQTSIAAKNSGMSLAFSSESAKVSPQALAAQSCPFADLIADARIKAASLASANGFTLGPIVAMTDGTSVPANIYGQLSPTALPRFLLSPYAPNPTVSCVVTVKFNMFRY